MDGVPNPAEPLDVTVVVATMDRRESLRRTLRHLLELPGAPAVVLVDNASRDGSADAAEEEFGGSGRLDVVRLPHNRGALARDEGVRRARTSLVAFSDDDSWWAPQALPRAAAAFEAHPRLGLVAARATLVPSGETDRASVKMASAPLGRRADLPGPPVLGFAACASVVRRSAFLEVGGFDELIFFGGEEELLSLDLAAAGWDQCYLDDVEALHGPAGEVTPPRWAVQERNSVLVSWLRRPLRVALRDTASLLTRAVHDGHLAHEVVELARRLPEVLRRRRPVAPELEGSWRRAHQPLRG
ncbi:glycosyltransferase [Kineococcus sp. R8]|nr:glycosyltransferase [Kineococcus siccus]